MNLSKRNKSKSAASVQNQNVFLCIVNASHAIQCAIRSAHAINAETMLTLTISDKRQGKPSYKKIQMHS
jgi:hypothetical protein